MTTSSEAQRHLDAAVEAMEYVLEVVKDPLTEVQQQNALASVSRASIEDLCDTLRRAHFACNEARAERFRAAQEDIRSGTART